MTTCGSEQKVLMADLDGRVGLSILFLTQAQCGKKVNQTAVLIHVDVWVVIIIIPNSLIALVIKDITLFVRRIKLYSSARYDE